MKYLFSIDLVEVGEVVIRSLFSLITLFCITKLIGKKQVSQLSLFDYVMGISIGNFAAEISINTELPYINGIVAVFVFGVVACLISFVTMKSMKLRRFFMGTPTILIEKGKLNFNNLKRVKFDINDLLEECRTSNYFDISQIEYAILEPNGQLSILPKGDYMPLTRKDMNLVKMETGLCANIIIDGKIMIENLKMCSKNIEWLLNEIKVKGYELDNILLATIDNNDKLNFYIKSEGNSKNILE